MSIDDKTIIGALRTLGDHDAAGDAPVAHLVSRGRTARARRRAATLGSTAAGIVALATALAVTTGPNTATPSGRDLSLAMAAQATAETSFHVVVTMHTEGLVLSGLVLAGDWDPVHHNGYLYQTSHGGISGPSVREVAGVCYSMRDTGDTAWSKYDGECGTNNMGWSPDTYFDPDALLARLAEDGSAKLVSRTGSGADEVDTWSYSWPAHAPGAASQITFAGTVKVDAATGYVTELTQQAFFDRHPDATTVTVEFSDFGTQFTVTAPPVVPWPSLPAAPTVTGTAAAGPTSTR